MPNRVNKLLLEEYTKEYKDADCFVSVGYEGLSSQGTVEFRDDLAKNDISLRLVKNKIVCKAFRDLERPDVASICSTQTAFAVGEDPVAVARFMVDFRKKFKDLKIHGAMVEDTILDENKVIDLSKSPTKDELKGIISGQAMAPGANFVAALMGPAKTIAGQIKALIEKQEEE